MLRHINLSRIPASLLLRIIQPLKIIPLRDLLKALLRVPLCRRVRYLPSKVDWRHGPSCRPGKRGESFCCAGDDYYPSSRGIAVAAFLPKARSSGVLEWSFEIIAADASSINLGFICQPAGQGLKDDIFEQSLKDLSSTRLLWISQINESSFISRREPKMVESNWEHFDTEMELGSVVNFKLNKPGRTCRVQFNSSQAVWEDLPDEDYYIAVEFSDCVDAGVELRLLSGFDYY